MSDLLRVRDLSTRFFTGEGQVNAVESVDFDVRDGEVFGVVGESGSGKSVTALSIVDLVESPGRITSGEIWYRNADLAESVRDDRPEAVDGEFVDVRRLSERQRRLLRGPSFGMVFQDPMSSLNPTLPVGEQIAEAVEVQRRASATPRSTRARTREYGLGSMLVDAVVPGRDYASEESRARAIELLEMVGIPDAAERADEPTTALDVTIQAQILELLTELQEETGMSIVLITHNLGVVARMCDRVGVMYAGEIVERGTLADVFEEHVHPYTAGLLGSIPDLDDPAPRLQPIEGNVPSLLDEEMGPGCYFADRCPKAMAECREAPPELPADGSDQHRTRCYLAEHEFDPDRALDGEAAPEEVADD